MPTSEDAFQDYMSANPNRSESTNQLYNYEARRYLGDWLSRPLDSITRRDVEARFNQITADHGWSPANRAISLLRSVYRRPCVDVDGLRDPVGLWLAGGGKFHRKARRKISAPAEVLPRWRAGIQAEVNNDAIRDALWFGLYTGMRRDEVLTLRWDHVEMDTLSFLVEETKTGVPLELPITRQLADVLERRRAANDNLPNGLRDWVFPSPTSYPPPATSRISEEGRAIVDQYRSGWLTYYGENWRILAGCVKTPPGYEMAPTPRIVIPAKAGIQGPWRGATAVFPRSTPPGFPLSRE